MVTILQDKIVELYNQKKYSLIVDILIQTHRENKLKISDYDLSQLITKIRTSDSLCLKDRERLISVIKDTIMGSNLEEKPLAKPIAFIVHGWDSNLRMETELFLSKVLNYECILLFEQDSEGLTIIEKFIKYASKADIAIVLLSDHDELTTAISDPNSLKRPRPNVLFEMGYFFSKVGRRNTIIFKRGNVEINSDVYGIEYIDVSNGVESQSEAIRRRLGFMKG